MIVLNEIAFFQWTTEKPNGSSSTKIAFAMGMLRHTGQCDM